MSNSFLTPQHLAECDTQSRCSKGIYQKNELFEQIQKCTGSAMLLSSEGKASRLSAGLGKSPQSPQLFSYTFTTSHLS